MVCGLTSSGRTKVAEKANAIRLIRRLTEVALPSTTSVCIGSFVPDCYAAGKPIGPWTRLSKPPCGGRAGQRHRNAWRRRLRTHRRVRALEPEDGGGMPAVALTAYARAEDRLKAMFAGFRMHCQQARQHRGTADSGGRTSWTYRQLLRMEVILRKCWPRQA